MNDYSVYPPSTFTIIVYLILSVAVILAIFAINILHNESEALKDRLRRVSFNLQLAELQTGVPYFTACGAPDAECESGAAVYARLQDHVANSVFSAAAAAEPFHSGLRKSLRAAAK